VNTVSTTGVLSADRANTVLKNFGKAKLSDYFGDLVVYRNLEPLDRRIPGRKNSSYKMEIPADVIPRKQDRDYAKAAVWIAQQAAIKVRRSNATLEEILFLGDTLYNDGQAFANMVDVGEWAGACFIGGEKPNDEPSFETRENNIYSANRWAAISDWMQWVLGQGLHVDERTVVIVDIDKTAIGAKGRNDQVINEARLEGIYRTMDAVLGEGFDRVTFESQYNELNRSRYHFLTEDNQDYLAYICMTLNAGIFDYDEILREIQNESVENFKQFLRMVHARVMFSSVGGENLRQAHEAVSASVDNGDPTPFKRFRRQEFITTVERMGNMPDNAAVAELLAHEITLTNEVCEVTDWLKERGCLCLCMSDKPDEASRPDPHTSPDLPPVHQAPTHRVGTSIAAELKDLA
jgi:hypothetical protein